ncbi:MAG: DUF364 domain-containing protein [Deferribacterales bacterium]
MKKAIICDLYESVEDKLKELTIVDYVLGLGYVGVETELGLGLAYTFRDSIPGGCNATDQEFVSKPANVIAEKIFSDNLLESAIGIATINSILNNGTADNLEITERYDFKEKVVSMVGYFKPFEEKISPLAKKLYIFELKGYQNTMHPGQAKLYIPQSDIVLITGTTFINKTTEDFLSFVPDDTTIVFIGASTPLSNIISRYGDILGSYVMDKDYCKRVLARGAGMKLLKKGLERRILGRDIIC